MGAYHDEVDIVIFSGIDDFLKRNAFTDHDVFIRDLTGANVVVHCRTHGLEPLFDGAEGGRLSLCFNGFPFTLARVRFNM